MKTLSVMTVGLFLGLPAAAQDAKTLIVGKWEGTQKVKGNDVKIEAEFKDDGTMVFTVRDIKVNGTYKLIDDKVIETEQTFEKQTRKLKQEYKVSQDTLDLKDPEGNVFTFKRAK
jgi:uncharacterized protein (TIGR03066 family)